MTLDRPFAEIVVESGYVTREEMAEILSTRTDTTEPIGDLLFRLKKLTAKQRIRCRAAQLGIPFVDLAGAEIDIKSAHSISHALAVRLKAIPIEKTDLAASVAMVDPLHLDAIDELQSATGLEIDALMATPEDVEDAIFRVFGRYDDLAELVKDAGSSAELDELALLKEPRTGGPMVVDLRDQRESQPIIKLTNAIIAKAILMRASDIHIEPQNRMVRIRLRIDGLLQEIMTAPKDLQQMLVSRIKILAGQDIAERRLPQDGRFSLLNENNEFDFRVSTYPSVHGETVVMRILDRQSDILDLSRLGIDAGAMDRVIAALDEPQGLVLVTGPTGSGKTTTLYAGLNYLNTQHRNIITIEDPVEYQLNGITQANINPRAGLTFATGLRSILRQDPDVILVGEIRDDETASISIEAALTGHLVLTSLHSNDSAGAISRLMDMSIEPFLIASSVTASISQRLVRLVCRNCQEPYKPDPLLLARLGLPAQRKYVRGRGCEVCAKTGFRGRVGVYEVLRMTPDIRRLLQSGADASALKELAITEGLVPVRSSAIRKVLDGLTTPEEVIRVTAEN